MGWLGVFLALFLMPISTAEAAAMSADSGAALAELQALQETQSRQTWLFSALVILLGLLSISILRRLGRERAEAKRRREELNRRLLAHQKQVSRYQDSLQQLQLPIGELNRLTEGQAEFARLQPLVRQLRHQVEFLLDSQALNSQRLLLQPEDFALTDLLGLLLQGQPKRHFELDERLPPYWHTDLQRLYQALTALLVYLGLADEAVTMQISLLNQEEERALIGFQLRAPGRKLTLIELGRLQQQFGRSVVESEDDADSNLAWAYALLMKLGSSPLQISRTEEAGCQIGFQLSVKIAKSVHSGEDLLEI